MPAMNNLQRFFEMMSLLGNSSKSRNELNSVPGARNENVEFLVVNPLAMLNLTINLLSWV